MIINPKVEMMPFSAKKNLIFERFCKNLRWAYEKSNFYHEKYTKANISPKDIVTFDDISKLPLTTVDELKAASAFDLLTGPLSLTLRLNKTISGLYRGSTPDDVARNIDIAIRPLASNDINKTSTLIICGNYSSQYLLDLHYAAEALGATVLPCNSVEAAIEATDIFKATTLIINSKNLQTILDTNPDALPPKIIVLTDSFSDTILTNIEQRLNRTLPKIYMSKYFGFAGILFTCEHNHLHIQDDYVYTETVDNKLVFTPLTCEAMPIIRLQMDINGTIDCDNICDCGRTFAKIILKD